MTERLSRVVIVIILLFSHGLVSGQSKKGKSVRKYYGSYGIELPDLSQINKQKALIITEEGYRTYSYVGKVKDLIASQGGRMPEPKSMKSDLSEIVNFTVESVKLAVPRSNHGNLIYNGSIGGGSLSQYSVQGSDSLTGECENFRRALAYNLALARLVDTTDGFFSDVEKKLTMEVTVRKLFFRQSTMPWNKEAEADFMVELKDVYGTSVYKEIMNIRSNLYPLNYIGNYVNGSSCDVDMRNYSNHSDLMFDLLEALAYEISYSPRIKTAIKKRSTVIKEVVEDSLITIRKASLKNYSVQQLLGSVVTIETDNGHGSGCIVSEDGYIISNHHVAGVKSKKLDVVTNDGTRYGAELIRTDAYSDLALIKVKSENKFVCNSPNDQSKLKLGDPVRVIGTPADSQLGQTLTAGIISSLRKNNKLDVIQTDAHINPGNSGGALINSNGELVGIVSSKAMGFVVEGIGFAIPVKYINERLKINFE
jgi:hypothetical protein